MFNDTRKQFYVSALVNMQQNVNRHSIHKNTMKSEDIKNPG